MTERFAGSPGARRRSLSRHLALVTGAAILAGCGATKQDVVRLESTTQDQHAQVRQELAGLRATVEQLSSAMRQLRANLDASLDEVNNRMGIVESLMRDNEQMFQRFQRRLQEAQQRQRRVEDIASADTLPEAGSRLAPDTARATGGERTGGIRPERPGVPSEIDLYNGALNDYQAGRYDLALAAFQEYLRLYPDGTSPDNAQFWIGKINLDQKKYAEADRELNRLLTNYPETDKGAQATFYLGNANRAMGREERARDYYRQVIERYPTSQEAQLARRELER